MLVQDINLRRVSIKSPFPLNMFSTWTMGSNKVDQWQTTLQVLLFFRLAKVEAHEAEGKCSHQNILIKQSDQ